MPTADLLRLLAAEPAASALLLDVDGTLAPIVARPAEASVPEATRRELRRLARRYALVACVSGRPAVDAGRVVGVPELTYVGEHGLELAPGAAAWAGRIAAFADGERREAERKPLTVSFHFRLDADEQAAVVELEQLAARARLAGLWPRWGRKVLEIRPPVAADKGTAVSTLLERAGLRRALYAGDDATDLDGFRALDTLELGVRVAVVCDESPPQLRAGADVVVATPAELCDLLGLL